jgi:hypothetical protein
MALKKIAGLYIDPGEVVGIVPGRSINESLLLLRGGHAIAVPSNVQLLFDKLYGNCVHGQEISGT